ncbi:glycosyltransferase family 1 protein [Ectopseudomonas mendocina]|uniref:Glycosyltransferase family 1 protein n=2 Tax=Ectopseudomonas mendocina TaxID=300 RepID=A0ABD7RR70_ECTME|nr:glycosyltransferase family 1 protein [Pseudomonas mendocina]TRO12143.1 glycosyltransferase family 1 protein [Pseudomonas mendocina]
MKRFSIVSSYARSLHNFRGDLVRKINMSGFQVDCLGPIASSSDLQKIQGLGGNYIPYRVDRNGLNPFNDFRMFASLFLYFWRCKPDAVMAYTIKPIIWSGIALQFMRGSKFYALITGLGFAFEGFGFKRSVLRHIVSVLYKISLCRAEKVIFQNPDDMRYFVSHGIVDVSKCVLIPGSGVDAEYFSYKPLPVEGDLVFLMISRLLVEKGVRFYVAAARLIKSRYPNVRFTLLGPLDSSPDAIDLEEVKTWCDEGIIEYLGETDDVRPFINDCHVFVLPSFYGEGLPRTILEAMSVGRPILTTDNVGCRETVFENQNGFLVPVRDTGALADRMNWFVEHQDELESMGLRSRDLVMTHFEVDIINNMFLRVFGVAHD